MNWQPIESAPRDGSHVLVSPGDELPITIGFFRPESWDKKWYSMEQESWVGCDCCGSGISHIVIEPKFWMPLPEPPK